MKIYNTKLDEYGWPNGHYEFLCDGWGSHSGWRWSAKLEMGIWNFIAKISNLLSNLKEREE
jgi:hypothetical protein